MKKMKQWRAEEFLALAVSVFLAVMFLFNAHLLYRPAKRLVSQETDFEEFTKEVQFTYTNNTAWKIPFINLNGLFARVTGQRICNQVIRLNNGMLCDQQPYPTDVYRAGREVLRLKDYLSEKGVPFLYVQAPYKVDLESQLLPEGTVSRTNDDATLFLDGLSQYGANTLDLRPVFSRNAQQVEENFFRTDHHWTFTTALRAFPIILERMDQLLPGQELDMSCAEFGQWEAHTLEDWFLGSWGKRTGVFFGGVDDLTYYTPKFPTRISRALPMEQNFFSGDFVQANLNMDYAQNRDYFHSSPYCIYADGDQPLVEHRNAGAANKLKVLLVKDSFGLPIECFFSTAFTEVDAIDPRFELDAMDSVMEYINNTRPDIVVMMITTTGLSETAYFDIGIDREWMREQAATGAQTVLFQGDVSPAAGEQGDGDACFELPVALEAGRRYTFRCDSIRREDGSAPAAGAAAVLRGPSEDSCVKSGVFDLDYGNQTGGFAWSFNIPADQDGRLRLLLYAGLPDQTDGVRLTYVNASLTLEE